MSEVRTRWVEKPVGRRSRVDWHQVVTLVSGNPGRWLMLVDELPSRTAWEINEKKLTAFQDGGEYEAEVRDSHKGADGRYWGTLFVRAVKA